MPEYIRAAFSLAYEHYFAMRFIAGRQRSDFQVSVPA